MKTHDRLIISGALLLMGTALPSLLTAQRASADLASLLERGREAFLDYDFDKALKFYAEYRQKAKRARQPIVEDIDRYEAQAKTGLRLMEVVQQLVVIDSVAVPAVDFFKHVRIPASAGFLMPAEEIPFKDGAEYASMAFTPESQSLMLWAQPDSLGNFRIVESARLVDGSYAEPVYTPDFLGAGGDADFPTLSPDGVTLWYSSDGDGSMGGYDIFETVRDAATGEYMPPSNVGMPFNSPYDDFLLVTDEQNGVGWWATDRNSLEDMVTLYVYMLPEMRRNVDPESDDLMSLARLSEYKLTWEADTLDNSAQYTQLASEIRAIRPGARPKPAEFHFQVSGGKVYTRYDQLPDPRSRTAMKNYQKGLADFDKERAALDALRRQYAAGRTSSLSERILEREKSVDAARHALRKLRNEVLTSLSR